VWSGGGIEVVLVLLFHEAWHAWLMSYQLTSARAKSVAEVEAFLDKARLRVAANMKDGPRKSLDGFRPQAKGFASCYPALSHQLKHLYSAIIHRTITREFFDPKQIKLRVLRVFQEIITVLLLYCC
jgi:hypothetical protein